MPAEQILERLMREYGDSVFRMCYLYLKDYYLAEDATQETFMILFYTILMKRHG